MLEKTFDASSKVSKIGLCIQFFGLTKDAVSTMSSYLNSFKILVTQLVGIDKNIEDEIKIAILIKSIANLDEYSSLVTTLSNLPNPNIIEIEASLLEKEKRISRKAETTMENAF